MNNTIQYVRGFYYFEVTVTTPRWGTFKTPVWARTQSAALAAANRKWKTSNAHIVRDEVT